MCCFHHKKHNLVVFSFDALLGWLGACLYHVMTITSELKPLWSFSFWLVISLYDLIDNVLSLCMIMAIIALLVGRSQSFAKPLPVLSMISTRASNHHETKFANCVHHIYLVALLLFQVCSSCFYLSSKLNFGMRKLVSKALTNLMAHLLSCT